MRNVASSIARYAGFPILMGAAIVATNGPALATRIRDLRVILDDQQVVELF